MKQKPNKKQIKLTITFLNKFITLNRKQQLELINNLERKLKENERK